METKDYLKILKDKIHSTVVATVDENGLPVTRVIDIMLVDEDSMYFITAKGKVFYEQLMDKEYIALSGMTSETKSLNKKAISIRGKVKNVGKGLLSTVFEQNPYMSDIYPTIESRSALVVFKLYEGQGEYFDLSAKPIRRESFAIGETALVRHGYFITFKCKGCGNCYTKCPQKCITTGIPSVINQANCLHCGNCIDVCPYDAVVKQ